MEIIGQNLEDVWVHAALAVLQEGELVSPRGKQTVEIRGMQLIMESPCDRIPRLPVREFSLAYAMGEMAWYLSSDDSLPFIRHYAASYGNYSDDGKRLHGAYGPRIFGCTQHVSDKPDPEFHKTETEIHKNPCQTPWGNCVKLLLKDPDTRQAVIPIFRPFDVGAVTKDMPCTLSLQLLLRDGALDMVTNMRSNDMWFGGLYDLFCFTILQELMANELGMKVGKYYHHVGSFHIYHKDVKKIEECVRAWGPPAFSRGIPPRIRPDQTVADLLHYEKHIRTCSPITALEELCGQMEDFTSSASLWEYAYAAWRWKRISNSVEIKEEQRRLVRGMLQDKIGLTFDRCFF